MVDNLAENVDKYPVMGLLSIVCIQLVLQKLSITQSIMVFTIQVLLMC